MRFATILIRPRETMRRILEQPRDRRVIPLVLLAMLSSSTKDIRLPGLLRVIQGQVAWKVVLMVLGVLVCLAIAALLLFYLFAWIAYWIGKAFDGRGSVRAVRSALAWGTAPVIWALLYRIPVALFAPEVHTEAVNINAGKHAMSFTPLQISDGCGIALAVALLNVVVLLGWAIVSSFTLAEAHDFSGGRAFATLLLSMLTPFVVMIAAVLSMS